MILAILQARMASTRLPGKVMAEIAGRPMIAHVVSRALDAQEIDQLVVATTTGNEDQPLADFCAVHAIDCFRGDSADVLDRFYQCADSRGASVIVRLTADCPLHDGGVIDRVVSAFIGSDAEYVSNTLPPTFPDGLDVEVFTNNALQLAWQNARSPLEREHVTPFIYGHPEFFTLKNVANETDYSSYRWTVDEAEDIDFVRAMYSEFGRDNFGMNEILELIRRRPELADFNTMYERNEGMKQQRENASGSVA